MRDLPEHERPIEVRYEIAARAYNEAAKVARSYKENKAIVFDKMVKEVMQFDPKLPMNKAQMMARASDAWQAFVDRLLEAADEAGNRKSELKAIEIEADRLKQAAIAQATERKYSRYG